MKKLLPNYNTITIFVYVIGRNTPDATNKNKMGKTMKMTYKKNDARIVAFAADIQERLEEISMGYDETAINNVARHIFTMADDHGEKMNYGNFMFDMVFALRKYVGMTNEMIRELGENNFKIMFSAWKLRKNWIF